MAPLSPEEARRIDATWRAANYLSVGQIYLLDNPLLREPLRPEHVKPRLLGHWGTTPGLNFLYAHINRAILERDLDAIFIAGPGHGGPALVASTWLEGSYSDIYHGVSRDEEGMRELFRRFSFPGGVPSHVAPETPGSIHEGGELGYALAHAYGAAFDNPDLLVCCVVGDGEAETGPLAASWHGNKFARPRQGRDGAPDPAPQRLQDREPDRARPDLARRARGAHDGVRAPADLRRGPRAGGHARPHGRGAGRGARRDRGDPREPGRPPAVADDRAALTQGLDRTEGGRRAARRGHVPLAPGAAVRAARQPRAPGAARGVAALVPARGAVRRGRPAPGRRPRARTRRPPADGREPARQRRAPAAGPPAAGLPRLRRRGARARGPIERGHARARLVPARRRAPQPRDVPDLRPRRDGLQPPRRRVRGDRSRVGARGARRRRPPRPRRPRRGGAQRAHVPGLPGGLPADRPARPVQLLRGVHPHHRLDVQPARQVAEGHARHPLAAARRVAQLPADLPRLAPGPQRLLAPGPRVHRPRGQQEGRDRARLPAAGRELPALGRRSLPAQPRLRQRHRGRQAARARLPHDGRCDRTLHARPWDLGLGEQR